MRRAYVESHLPLTDAYIEAKRWAGTIDSVIAPSTRAIEASPWLERVGVRLGVVGNRHSRFAGRPHGAMIAWCLNLEEILELERRNRLSSVVAVQAAGSLRSWVTAHQAEHLGGEILEPVPEASPATKAMVEGITSLAVTNQGLIDGRERSAAIQALTYLHVRGHQLDPSRLTVEAIRNGWPGEAPIKLAQLARDINAGKRLRYQDRIRHDLLDQWARMP